MSATFNIPKVGNGDHEYDKAVFYPLPLRKQRLNAGKTD